MKKPLFSLIILPVVLVVAGLTYYQVVWAVTAYNSNIHTDPNDLFYNYTTWTTSSNTPIGVDILSLNAEFYCTNSTTCITPNKFSFVDINGDNLPDFLYFDKGSGDSSWEYSALFLNNGNNNFNLAYKCAKDKTGANPTRYTAYGDCASTAPERDPNAAENQNQLAKVLFLANFSLFLNNSSSDDPPVYNHIWIDINGDGFQDFIDNCLNINLNQPGENRIFFSRICN